jgi:transcription antitermination factor NusG
MNKWYVVQTKPRKEDEVVKRFGMADLETFNPKMKSLATGLRHLFPNYVFVRWDLTKAHKHHMIKYTRGVNKVLGSKEMPVPISDEIIDLIKERIDTSNTIESQTFKRGSRVKVKRGLLKDLIGILEKPVSAEGRVAVLLRLYEREMKAVLNCKDIALVA